MNLWVLFLCHFLLHSKVSKKRIWVVAFGASIGEVLIVCVPLGNSLLKIMFGFGSITALCGYYLFRPESKKYFYKIMIYSYFSVISLGGILLGLESITNIKKIPVLILGILIVVCVFVIEKLYEKFETKEYFCDVILVFNEKNKCKIKALIDSGNGLIEPVSKSPVSIVEKRVVSQYQDGLKKENFRIIPFHSIGNKAGILEAFFIEKMEIKKDGESFFIEKPMIAITKDDISVNRDYQMILHPKLLD